jgi:hypothetical protein
MQALLKTLLRDRDETSLLAVLCLAFELRLTEARVLLQLMTSDYTTITELRTAASTDKNITLDSTRVFLCSLRAKLKLHNVLVTTVSKLGYGLDTKSRANIRRGIEKYDAEGVGARPRKPEPELKAAPMPD